MEELIIKIPLEDLDEPDSIKLLQKTGIAKNFITFNRNYVSIKFKLGRKKETRPQGTLTEVIKPKTTATRNEAAAEAAMQIIVDAQMKFRNIDCDNYQICYLNDMPEYWEGGATCHFCQFNNSVK